MAAQLRTGGRQPRRVGAGSGDSDLRAVRHAGRAAQAGVDVGARGAGLGARRRARRLRHAGAARARSRRSTARPTASSRSRGSCSRRSCCTAWRSTPASSRSSRTRSAASPTTAGCRRCSSRSRSARSSKARPASARRSPCPARCSPASASIRSIAAGICLLANTAPVAFGSIGIPVTTLANVTGLPVLALSAMVGRLCAMISVFIPGYLIVVMAGPAARARSAAGDRRLRRVVRGHAVLRVELRRTRADRHRQLATCIVVHGGGAEALAAGDASCGSRATAASTALDERPRRRRDLSSRGCRTCCWSCSCSSWGEPAIKREHRPRGRNSLLPASCRRADGAERPASCRACTT